MAIGLRYRPLIIMELEDVKNIILKEKENSLRISRVPHKVRENFLKLADEEFEGDYGMTLKYLWDTLERQTIFFDNFDIKLNYIIRLNEEVNKISITDNIENEQNGKCIKSLSGKVIKGGNKNE
jgi:hypothetical protein